jgi:hypothetical protein
MWTRDGVLDYIVAALNIFITAGEHAAAPIDFEILNLAFQDMALQVLCRVASIGISCRPKYRSRKCY